MRTLAQLVSRHRRRLASAVAVVGLAMLGGTLWEAAPRESDLELSLGARHRQVVEIRVAYLRDGEELQGVRFGFPAGAPDVVRHRVRLPPGRFEVRLELRGARGRVARFVRTLDSPADGVVRLDLAEERS